MFNKMRITAIATLCTATYLTGATTQVNMNQQRQNANQQKQQNANQQKASVAVPPPAAQVKPADDMVKLSGAVGNYLGQQIKKTGVSYDLESILKGMRDGYEGKPSPLTPQEFESMMTAVQEQAFNKLAQKNLNEANEFLVKNAKAKGVFEVEPGKLQYIILQEGKGATVQADSKPLINYTGRYLNGDVFDSSENVGGPVTIPLSQTISGFSRALAGMKEGEKRKIFIHPDLGYGTQSPLEPNAMLVFDVEVVKAQSPEKEDTKDHKEDAD